MSNSSIASWQCLNCGQWVNGTHSCERLTDPLPPIEVSRVSQPLLDSATLERIANALERIAAALEAQSQVDSP